MKPLFLYSVLLMMASMMTIHPVECQIAEQDERIDGAQFFTDSKQFTSSYLTGIGSLPFLISDDQYVPCERSLRIMGMSQDLGKIVRDEYTDLFYNPAYVSAIDHSKLYGLFGLKDRYLQDNTKSQSSGLDNTLVGIVGNPLGFITEGGTGAIILDAQYRKRSKETINDRYSSLSSSGRLYESEQNMTSYDREQALDLYCFYALPLSPRLSIGAGYVHNSWEDANRGLSEYSSSTTDLMTNTVPSDRWYHSQNRSGSDQETRIFTVGMLCSLSPCWTLDVTSRYFDSDESTFRAEEFEEYDYNLYESSTHHGEYTDRTEENDTQTYPFDKKAWGAFIDLIQQASPTRTMHWFGGVRYEEFDVDFSGQEHYSYVEDDVYDSTVSHGEGWRESCFLSVGSGDKITLGGGLGAELHLKGDIILGLACKGRIITGSAEATFTSSTEGSSQEDTTQQEYSDAIEQEIESDLTAYDLRIPVGLETRFWGKLALRLGTTFVATHSKQTEDIWEVDVSSSSEFTQEESSLSSYLSFGLGYRIGNRLTFDFYTAYDLASLNSWQIMTTVDL